MSTRANVIFINPDETVKQFYHHFDGYLEGVGCEMCIASFCYMRT